LLGTYLIALPSGAHPLCLWHLKDTATPTGFQNKTTKCLEIFNLYPEADLNDAWYPIMKQVRHTSKMNADRVIHLIFNLS
jgi:hypothetical protein